MAGLGVLDLALAHLSYAAIALVMLSAIITIGYMWGFAESLVATVAGGLILWYVLPPLGFGLPSQIHSVTLVMFVCAAAATARLFATRGRSAQERDSLFHLAQDALCIHDRNGRFLNVNEAMVVLLGVPEKELRSRHLLDFVHPEDHGAARAALQQLAESGGPVEFEVRCRSKNRGWRLLHWKMMNPPGVSWDSAAVRDVTEERAAQEQLLKLTEQVMTVQVHERRRIARELHDDITQKLATLGIELGLLKKTGGPGSREIDGELGRLQSQILGISEDLRTFSHSIHPAALEHSGLATALEAYCREFSVQNRIEVDFVARDMPETLPRAVEIAFYRIAQEALRNVARHSGATEANVALAGDGGHLSLHVIDNGRGFDVNARREGPGLGLVSIHERARQIKASVKIDSAPGVGTTIGIQV